MSIVCWTGRVLALGLFLFWGASFVEHLQHGFLHPVKELPPVWVWLGYLAHLTFLVGLVALWRWQLTGSILTILGTLSFFGGLAISEATTGKQYLSCLAFLTVTIIPALLNLACWLARPHALVAAKTPLAETDEVPAFLRCPAFRSLNSSGVRVQATGISGRFSVLAFVGLPPRSSKAVMKSLAWYLLAALGEIGGCFAFWAWRRMQKSPLWAIPGTLSLIMFALALTRIDAAAAGRAYAAYGGVYILSSVVWLWAVEEVRPDRWDIVGALVCLAGAAVILYGPHKG